jgi:lambda family phage portal protein
MSLWQNLFGRRKPRREVQVVEAKFDAALTTLDNARHWAQADSLSADAAMSPDVRQTLRNRSRYEVANNAYAKGMVSAIAGDCIGTGPRLQLIGEADRNNEIEDEFERWAEAVDLAGKLRTMRIARASDGEAFAVLVNNPKINHPVKLDLHLVEADRVTSRDGLSILSSNVVDGIEYDQYGNPTVYHVLKHHPGDMGFALDPYERIPAYAMIHWFTADRPGQHRGIPEITPALPLFAQLRRYTLAVLAAAETAADFAAVLFTTSPANGEAAEIPPLDLIPLTKRMMTSLPEGWQIGQIKAEHPSTTYAEFKREILSEIGRCMLVPINVVTGDSSQHNYASGRLDHQTYFRTIRIDQSSCERMILDRTFELWYEEYHLLTRNRHLSGCAKISP